MIFELWKIFLVTWDKCDILPFLIEETIWKLIGITIQVIINVFVLVYAEIRSFIATCVLYSRLASQYQRFRKVSHQRMNSWAIEGLLLLVDCAKTRYTRYDEGLHFCIKLAQHT